MHPALRGRLFPCSDTLDTSMAKTITLNASPTWPGVSDDYVLYYEGHSIGRMRLTEGVVWEWYLDVPMEMPAWAKGKANNLDECRGLFVAAWARLLKETSPARLERAWELARAVQARQQRTDAVKTDVVKNDDA